MPRKMQIPGYVHGVAEIRTGRDGKEDGRVVCFDLYASHEVRPARSVIYMCRATESGEVGKLREECFPRRDGRASPAARLIN